MNIRIRYDIITNMGNTIHQQGYVELPRWNAAEALKQLKWRNPSAKKIKILSHD